MMANSKMNGKAKIVGGISISAVIALVIFIFAIEDRYANAADVVEGLNKVSKAIGALEKRITRGELESSHRFWSSVKFDFERRFGIGCESCEISDQALYATAVAEVDLLAIRLLRQ